MEAIIRQDNGSRIRLREIADEDESLSVPRCYSPCEEPSEFRRHVQALDSDLMAYLSAT